MKNLPFIYKLSFAFFFLFCILVVALTIFWLLIDITIVPTSELKTMLIGITVSIVLITVCTGFYLTSHLVRSINQQKDLDIKLQERTELMKKNVQEMEEAIAKTEAVLSSIGDAIVVIDENGVILLINKAFEELVQTTLIHIINQNIFDLFPIYTEEDVPVHREDHILALIPQAKPTITRTYHFMRKPEQKLTLSVRVTPIIKRGQIVGAATLIRNVTKEKEVDRMKTEFISLASHQLRTPLSAIKWFTEMLLNGDAGKLNQEQEEFAKNINASTERMIQLVNSLLNISRMESGRIIIDPQPTDLKELFNGIVVDLKARIESKKQSLIVNIHNDLPTINIDPKLMRQVFLNLITNAIKYTPEGGEITIFISKKDNDVVCQITDNGYGIPKHQQEKVFQKFFRAENVAKVETDGTGLGLYLVKSIIESSQGKISFESEEGKGTTFWVVIPLIGMQPKEGEVSLD